MKRASDKKVCYSPSCIFFHNFMPQAKAMPEAKAMHHGKSLPQAKVMPAQVFYCKSIDFIPHAKIIIRKWDGSGDHALRIMGKSGKINIVF